MAARAPSVPCVLPDVRTGIIQHSPPDTNSLFTKLSATRRTRRHDCRIMMQISFELCYRGAGKPWRRQQASWRKWSSLCSSLNQHGHGAPWWTCTAALISNNLYLTLPHFPPPEKQSVLPLLFLSGTAHCSWLDIQDIKINCKHLLPWWWYIIWHLLWFCECRL